MVIDRTERDGHGQRRTRRGGIACRVKAWRPGDFYPHAKPTLELTLTAFPDPDGEATYFFVPNPADERLVDDELLPRARCC